MNRRIFARNAAAALALPAGLRRNAFAGEQAGSSDGAARFSFMLWALEKQFPFDRCLEIVASAGYQGVELTGEFQKWSPAEMSRSLSRMKGLGLVVDSMSGVRAGFAVPQETELFFSQFAEHLQFAQKLSCPQVILLSGNRKRAGEMASKARIEIVIEPIDLLENPTIYLASVTDAFEITRAVAMPSVKVLYDVYHEQRSFGNLIEKLEQGFDQLGLIHIADVPGRHEPGTGEVDYTMIYRKLAALGYKHWIAMEYYPTEEPTASLRRMREAAQAAMRSPATPAQG
jgi:hydroxypyruvate isomerase